MVLPRHLAWRLFHTEGVDRLPLRGILAAGWADWVEISSILGRDMQQPQKRKGGNEPGTTIGLKSTNKAQSCNSGG